MRYLSQFSESRDNNFEAVVGSIWTLAYEVTCYAILFLVGVTRIASARSRIVIAASMYIALWSLAQYDPPSHISLVHLLMLKVRNLRS